MTANQEPRDASADLIEELRDRSAVAPWRGRGDAEVISKAADALIEAAAKIKALEDGLRPFCQLIEAATIDGFDPQVEQRLMDQCEIAHALLASTKPIKTISPPLDPMP